MRRFMSRRIRRRRVIRRSERADRDHHCWSERRRKTTFARGYLSADERSFEFVNADEIAGDLAGQETQASMDFVAARSMLRRVGELVEAGADFVVETTLANLTYAQKIPDWQRRGYLVSLVYLQLDSVEDSIARVRKRVAAGGHWHSRGRNPAALWTERALLRHHLSADSR